MALNKFMHPRNPYKDNRPDFKKLALDHEGFRKVAKQSLDGKVTIDFKNPECLKALTEALLLSDFGLSVYLPSDRLVPAVPQRLNYLLWLEDLLADKREVVGIDVGCGSSCIYALLGSKMNRWQFIATDIDEVNLRNARDNVMTNNMSESVTVLPQVGDSLFKSATDHYFKQSQGLNAGDEKDKTIMCIDFSMCNPPFFDPDESPISRGMRPEACHVSTASPTERSVTGGEVEFVKRMIDESIALGLNIRIYTSMVGKKSSLAKLKQYLREKNIPKISTTEFCQGRTMRWAIAWTFDEHFVFPKSLFQQQKGKASLALVHTLSPDIKCCLYDVPAVTHFIKYELLVQLEMKCTTLHQDVGEFVCVVTASKNTWSHSRRKRRAAKQKEHIQAKTQCETAIQCETETKCETADESCGNAAKKQRIDSGIVDAPTPGAEQQDGGNSVLSVDELSSADEKPLITFTLEVRLEGIHINLCLKLMDSSAQKDMLNQILQYFKNRLV